MPTFVRLLLSIPLLLFLVIIMMLNIKSVHTPAFTRLDNDTINTDLKAQLKFLQHAIDKGADREMQKLYPEGYVFLNAIYALSWCNVAGTLSDDSPYKKQGMKEINKAWQKINSVEGRAPFDQSLPSYGSFYTGWNNYVLGRKLLLEPATHRQQDELEQFKIQCNQIATALKDDVYPETYAGSSWPADVVVCVASLVLHEKLIDNQYTEDVKKWLSQVRANLDSNRLIPHAASRDGQPVLQARGSSQSLMLTFLPEVDPNLATQQFLIFKEKFIDSRGGLKGVLEYPKGTSGHGDVDSGPVIFGMGASGTIAGMNAMYAAHDTETADEIRTTIEVLGVAYAARGQKQYLLGQLPMADAFIAWGHSHDRRKSISPRSVPFHLYSILLALIISTTFWLLWKVKPTESRSKNIQSAS